jgi:anti-anti-sigma factor
VPTSPSDFSVVTLPTGGFSLFGELDMASAPTLTAALAATVDGSPVVLDVSGLTFIDSVGVGCLFGVWRRTGYPVVIRSPRRQVARLLQICMGSRAEAPWLIVDREP